MIKKYSAALRGLLSLLLVSARSLFSHTPLQSVANLSKRAGVMVRGRWLPESELRKMLEKYREAQRA
jgi:hypothetical protein